MLNHYTGIDEMERDRSFKIPYVQVDMGVSYNTFRDPKDFNKPPGIYWIQGSGGHYSEWDGQKFNDDTEGARKATNDYYRNWHDSSHYYATGGKIGTYTGMINWPYIKELNYTFDQSGSFTEPTSFDYSNYWRKDRSPQHG